MGLFFYVSIALCLAVRLLLMWLILGLPSSKRIKNQEAWALSLRAGIQLQIVSCLSLVLSMMQSNQFQPFRSLLELMFVAFLALTFVASVVSIHYARSLALGRNYWRR